MPCNDAYEILEPDQEDEYYDMMCAAMYTSMFNRGEYSE